MSHTPGPWIVESGDSTSKFIYDNKGEDGYLGALATVEHGDPDELEANACLIAAAPELLAALEAAVYFLEENKERIGYATRSPMHKKIEEMNAAIAKAKGEA